MGILNRQKGSVAVLLIAAMAGAALIITHVSSAGKIRRAKAKLAQNEFDLATANSVALEVFASAINYGALRFSQPEGEALATTQVFSASSWQYPHPSAGANTVLICTPSTSTVADTDLDNVGALTDCSSGTQQYRTTIWMEDLSEDGNQVSLQIRSETSIGSKSLASRAEIFVYTKNVSITGTPCRFSDPDYFELVPKDGSWPSWVPNSNPNDASGAYPIGIDIFHNVRPRHISVTDTANHIQKINRHTATTGMRGNSTLMYYRTPTSVWPDLCGVIRSWAGQTNGHASTYCDSWTTPKENYASVEYFTSWYNDKGHLGIGFGPMDSASCTWHIFAARSRGCFAKGTLIRLFDGSEKEIEDLKGGEILLNPRTGKGARIKQIVNGPEKEEMYQIQTASSDVTVTSTHPMVADSGLVMAKHLIPGQMLEMADGTFEAITTIEIRRQDSDVYNIEIDTDSDLIEDHLLYANGVVSGDLYLQRTLEDDATRK